MEQYADDRNLSARQRLWAQQSPPFDLFGWTLDLAGVRAGQAVLDVGCGNGAYLRAMTERGVTACGCDLSFGMLESIGSQPRLCNADVMALPFPNATFDVVLAPHMLYYAPDRSDAARELRRVLRAGGVCVAVTNGAAHVRELRDLVEAAVRKTNPAWEWQNPSLRTFSLENGGPQLSAAFASVQCVRAEVAAPVVVHDADVVADYVASVGDAYQHEIDRPWSEIVDDVRVAVQRIIDNDGAFTINGESGAFVCR